MKKWEYYIATVPAVRRMADDMMNIMGSEGWELVTVVSDGGGLVAFFKKEAS